MTLKELRISKGLTQKQVAEKCDIAECLYQRYEYGKVMPSVVVGIKIAKVLGVRVEEIWIPEKF